MFGQIETLASSASHYIDEYAEKIVHKREVKSRWKNTLGCQEADKWCGKYIKLGVPKWIIKVLVQWYCNQSMCVRWGSAFSGFFLVNNCVRQGGILSPLLFNVYINELSVSLSKLPVGCCCGNTVVNHLMYADDIVLFAPSAKGLQKTINVYYAYGCDNDIIFNSSK